MPSMRPAAPLLTTPVKKRISFPDIRLNVSFQDSLIRFGILFLLPMMVLLIDKHFLIYLAPIMGYLFITALIQFCLIKYIWHRFFKGEIPSPTHVYGSDLNYPEESV